MSTTHRPLVDGDAAAAYLGTSPRHLRSLKTRGEVPFVQLGRLVRYDLDQLDAVRDARTVPATPAVQRLLDERAAQGHPPTVENAIVDRVATLVGGAP